MSKPNRIFVVGHMGAGKAVFAEALAKQLGWQYIDANPSLERYIGRTLNEIVGTQGEEAFHRCEHEILTHYMKQDKVVVVLEEGVIATKENRELLSKEFVIYLQVETATQIERMQGGRIPLLPIADMNAFLDQLHNERDHYFEEVATMIIPSQSIEGDVGKVLNEINS